jgi:ABC-type uncharacterized transport system ATPase subunit
VPRLLERLAGTFSEPLYGVVGDFHYPVPEGRLRIAGLDAQRLFASGDGLFKPITMSDAQAELMLLDEPTQGMGHEDVKRVTELIKKVSKGRTILMVEHNMSVVAGICDRISVLQRGAILAEGDYETVSRNPQVLEAYMGGTTPLEGAHG